MSIDKDLWRENGQYSSSESDSGKSDLDDDYFKLRPPYNPDEHRNSTVIPILPNQFSANAENTLKIPSSTPHKSNVLLDLTSVENLSPAKVITDSNLEINNTIQANVQPGTKKKRVRKKSKRKKKLKTITNEHQNINSASSSCVTDIGSSCHFTPEDDTKRVAPLVNANITDEANQLEVSLIEVHPNDSSYADSDENTCKISAITNATSEACEQNNSLDFSQYPDLLAYETATFYLNLEKEYLSNMSCLTYLLDHEASKHNINIEHPSMSKKEVVTKKPHTREYKNFIVEAIVQVIIFGLRPFETIFQELWNEFF